MRIKHKQKGKLLVFGYNYHWKMLLWYLFISKIVVMYFIIPNIQKIAKNLISYCINGLIRLGKIQFLIFHLTPLEWEELYCIQIAKEFFWFKKSINLVVKIVIHFQGDKLMSMNKFVMQRFVRSEKRLALKQNLLEF